MGATVLGNHALSQAVALHFKSALTVHLADVFLQQAFCALGLTVRQSLQYQTHGLCYIESSPSTDQSGQHHAAILFTASPSQQISDADGTP